MQEDTNKKDDILEQDTQDENIKECDLEQNIKEEDEQLNCEIDELKEKLEQALKQQEEYLNIATRVQADFDNFRKRNQNVRKEAYDSGSADFAKSLLPVIDNFERAFDSCKDEESAVLTGMKLVYKLLLEAFEKRGIKQVARIGEQFDPQLEEVIAQGNPEDGEPGTICEVLQKGYTLDGAVIRYSMVKVVPQ